MAGTHRLARGLGRPRPLAQDRRDRVVRHAQTGDRTSIGKDRGMRVALVNPPWDYRGSIYFGCREPHLPLELGYSEALLGAKGHRTLLLDANLMPMSTEAAADQ